MVAEMRIIVACESSERVKAALQALGHDAHSCDLLPGELGLPNHHVCDIRDLLALERFDMMIAFPSCTHLAVSGARWFKYKLTEQAEAIEFFMYLVNAPIPRIAIENPIGIMSTRYRKPNQVIQPWQYGHGEVKATCLWLKGLPRLVPTEIVGGRVARVHRMPPSPDRWRERSRTYPGIADAMANQWAGPVTAPYLEKKMYQWEAGIAIRRLRGETSPCEVKGRNVK